MANLNWQRLDDADINGTSLIKILNRISSKAIQTLFGDLPAGHSNLMEECSDHIFLKNDREDLVYTLYTVYGTWRIGGYMEHEKYAEDLAAKIYERQRFLDLNIGKSFDKIKSTIL